MGVSMAQVLRDNEQEVIRLRNKGTHINEIAKRYGVSNFSVRSYLSKIGVIVEPYKNSEKDVARKIFEKTGGKAEYISGYTTKENPVRVRCTVCGGEYERTFHHFTVQFKSCPLCKEQERQKTKDEETARREAEAAKRKTVIEQQKKERAERIASQKQKHLCPVCGKLTTRKKYCSDTCMHKAQNSAHDVKRRHRIRAAMVDNDITVEGLYRRDKGVCYLCGLYCNYEDYTVKDGNFIAGDWYPSIDHVIPLSKGGKHSWKNVRLAHRRCNWKKSTDIFE